jgi:hypothetical protein
MLIIDSLSLAKAFFSLGVVWGTLSLLASAVRCERFVCKLEGTQPGAVLKRLQHSDPSCSPLSCGATILNGPCFSPSGAPFSLSATITSES